MTKIRDIRKTDYRVSILENKMATLQDRLTETNIRLSNIRHSNRHYMKKLSKKRVEQRSMINHIKMILNLSAEDIYWLRNFRKKIKKFLHGRTSKHRYFYYFTIPEKAKLKRILREDRRGIYGRDNRI